MGSARPSDGGVRARFHAPTTLADARALLEHHAGDVALSAGGTYRMLLASREVEQAAHTVSLHRIADLDVVRRGGVGALATLRRLERGPMDGPERALTMAASVTAGPLIRSVATAGGNVASGKGDLMPALLVLDAVVHLDDGRALPMVEYVTARPRDGIVTRFSWSVTREEGWSAATVKLARRGMDWPIVTAAVAVRLDAGGVVVDARVAAGALAATPVVLPEVAAALIGFRGEFDVVVRAVEAACVRLQPPTDAEASGRLRRRVAPAVVATATGLAVDLGPDGTCDVEESLR
jgi:CO/xanthine dehydrogenase FAD-binding subunit